MKISRKIIVELFLSWILTYIGQRSIMFVKVHYIMRLHWRLQSNREYAWTFKEDLYLFTSNYHNGRCLWESRKGRICNEWKFVLFFFSPFLWNIVKSYLWQKYISLKWHSACLRNSFSSKSVHTSAIFLSISATKRNTGQRQHCLHWVILNISI